ncbi:MAG: helix-turn-helix domain containing protein [Methylobacterium frigidaeris]
MAKTSRMEIVLVARELFRDRGYAGTSMKDIADRVGLLKGSLYAHFASKEDLVPEVLALAAEEFESDLPPSADWAADFAAALERLAGLLRQGRRCLGLHLLYGLADDGGLAAPVVAFFGRLRRFLAGILGRGMARAEAEALAAEAIALLEGATLWRLVDDDDAVLRRAVISLRDRVEAHRQQGVETERLVARIASLEDEVLILRAALAGRIEAESCFR